jgi:transcriptional regulator with XRE-family HTH domain
MLCEAPTARIAMRTNRFGRSLKLCRVLTDVTQEELASQLEITQGTVAAWELGMYRPREERFERLISVFRELKEQTNDAGMGMPGSN